MLSITVIQTIMLIIAIALLAIPFIKNQSIFSKTFFLTAILTICLALILHHYNNNSKALQQWLTTGKQHYDLLVEFNNMGGLDGMIKRIKEKLERNPADAEGWQILGRLYLKKEDAVDANAAFEKARQLKTTH